MIKKELLQLNVADLVPYENNPRQNDTAVAAVAESIKQCGYIAPIIVDEDNIILAGHTRYKAMQTLGIDKCAVMVVQGLTSEQKRKYRLLDNKTNELAVWDFDKLAEELDGLDFDGFDFGFELDLDSGNVESKYEAGKGSNALVDNYIEPPFSVLDSASGRWQERKNCWKTKIFSKNGRDETLLGNGLKQLALALGNKALTGTSEFDPVLAEIMLAWFCPEHGRVIDPFAGGSVRGLVSAYTGREYVGMDLSQRQINANEDNYNTLKDDTDFYSEPLRHPTWICGDSATIDDVCKDKGEFDFLLTCPPYADLEVYSDNPKDLSTMKYPDFVVAYSDIIRKATSLLKDNAFAVCIVGEVRSKSGEYYNFVSDTIKAFTDAGLAYYNEIILKTALATAALRAGKQFAAKRKVVKTHQNVLVFVKGDPAKISLEPYQYDFDLSEEETEA